MSEVDRLSLIERSWANTVVVGGKTYVLAQEAQVELRDTNRAAWDRVAEAEQQLRGAVDEIGAAHERLTEVGAPTHDDHGKPLGLVLRIAVLADEGGQ